eukprot:TRINITY_DN17986_c0_g1_i1.p1 TRINITY_DN17986_c0_g1~~TRINITY_DN17986_c0_g1_i1.p1  ORF type:complete len:668 (+),score=370.14 TRINITY_DN17986_c0_g1_i1:159-2162(+)
MIDLFSVVHRGGCVLLEVSLTEVGGEPVSRLVQEVLLEERRAQERMEHGEHVMEWVVDNRSELVFVAAYLTISRLSYVGDLLQALKKAFVSRFADDVKRGATPPLPEHFDSFKATYKQIVRKFEQRHLLGRATAKKPRDFAETKRGSEITKDQVESRRSRSKKKRSENKNNNDIDDDDDSDDSSDDNGNDQPTSSDAVPTTIAEETEEGAAPTTPAAATTTTATTATTTTTTTTPTPTGETKKRPLSKEDKLKKLLSMRGSRRGRGGAPGPRRFKPKASPKSADGGKKKKTKPVKQATKWKRDVSQEELASLDFSCTNLDDALRQTERVSIGDLYGDASDEEWSDVDSDADDDDQKNGSAGGLFGWVKGIVGAKELTQEDIDPVLRTLKDKLMHKNVATDIAEKICESVGANLVGRKTGTFQTVASLVRESLVEALTRILTPKRSTNVLQGVRNAQAQKRPYTIVFVGVNGVGKSTSLSKVAAYLTSKDLTVSVAACDTFRSGAVQQLKTHCTRLGLNLFERGYNSDAASVAREAVKAAKKRGDDVVLIDTAGRMQDNAPLMRALSKLINLNKPDLVLFVGEALVGNDGVDQLMKFNNCLVDLSDGTDPRLIDGILLTKFDTIDDKVGAAISMTYSSGVPIMFVGVGQDYGDLKKMNVKMLIKKLMK